MQKRDKFGRFLKGSVKQSITKKNAQNVKKVAVKKEHKDSCDYWDRWTNPKKSKKKAHRNGTHEKPKLVRVSTAKKGQYKGPKLSELSLYDLQDIIQAEVQFQMKELW